MKRFFAILLLIVYLFNLAGYQLVFQYFMERSDKQLALRADEHRYNDEELLELKIPLHTPYMTTWSDYERVDGEVEVLGIHYNYVKRKVCNDTLYLQCLPNTSKTRLQNGLQDYAKHANELPANEKGKKFNKLAEYDQPGVQFCLNNPEYSKGTQASLPLVHVTDPSPDNAWHPPQVVS